MAVEEAVVGAERAKGEMDTGTTRVVVADEAASSPLLALATPAPPLEEEEDAIAVAAAAFDVAEASACGLEEVSEVLR
jgi:hypothetical protein